MRSGGWPFPVVDFHVHLPVPWPGGRRGVERYLDDLSDEQVAALRRSARDAAKKRWAKWGFEPPEREPADPETQASRWAAEVERHGLELAVLTTGGGNDLLASLIRMFPDRLVGFAHHPVTEPDAADELERAVVDLGLRGYKIFATGLKVRLDADPLAPLWAKVAELGIPVLVHFGVGTRGMGMVAGPSADPLVLQNVARRWPEIDFVVPHFGAGYLRELLMLCWACSNVHVDCSGSNEWLDWVPERLDRRELLDLFRKTVGAERLVFGTDSSYFPRGFVRAYLEEWLEVSEAVGMGETERALFFGGNALRLLGVDRTQVPGDAGRGDGPETREVPDG